MNTDVTTRLRFYTKEKLSGNMALTPEGFLLCREVPIARTGEQLYGPYETPINAGPDGIVHIQRNPEDVFRPETIASFNGKPVVDEHPDGDVNPDNWSTLAVGVVLEPYRGQGSKSELLLADVMITTAAAIEAVLGGKRELSCGYDADYDEISTGVGRQYNIVGNHVALVESGRCGTRCSIRDSVNGGFSMKVLEFKNKVRDVIAKIKAGTADCDSAEKVLNEVKDDAEIGIPAMNHARGAHYTDSDLQEKFAKYDQLHSEHSTRLDAHDGKHKAYDESLRKLEAEEENSTAAELEARAAAANNDAAQEEEKAKEVEGELEEEAPPGTGDKARKAKDSAYLDDSFKNTIAMAEILAPGISFPTYDKALDPKKTYQNLCDFRRKAISQAVQDEQMKELFTEMARGRTLDSLKCSAVRDIFTGMAAAKKRLNTASIASSVVEYTAPGGAAGGAKLTPAELNKRHANFYQQQ